MYYYFSISTVFLVVDQVAKNYMAGLLPLCVPGYCQSIEILPVFELTVLHNTGAAFSFLADAGGWQRGFLVAVSLAVSLFIVAISYLQGTATAGTRSGVYFGRCFG